MQHITRSDYTVYTFKRSADRAQFIDSNIKRPTVYRAPAKHSISNSHTNRGNMRAYAKKLKIKCFERTNVSLYVLTTLYI